MSSAERPDDDSVERSVETVATEYLEEVRRDQDSDKRLPELRSRLEERKAMREEFADRHAEDSPFLRRYDQSIEELEAEIEEKEAKLHQHGRLKEELLELFKEFELAEPWLNLKVLQAFNHAVTGKEQDSIVVSQISICSPEDLTEVDEETRWRIEDEIVCLATEEQGEANHTNKIWEWMQEHDYDEGFAVVASKNGANAAQVAEVLGQEQKETRNRLDRPIYRRDRFVPYYRVDGEFKLSTAGQYLASKYGPFESGKNGNKDSDNSDDSGDDGDGQMSFEDME
ncbi:hypothetical protein [Salinigranum salinum]|uniref:hypothetical protein n=1 Tax=Salinigranum salinum TaxID=1364937 RepID=UPI00126051CF|nr:hypothetical protein [Salinigranum salinum]